MMKHTACLFSILMLNACAIWPPQGKGGQAESFETAPAYLSSLRQANKEKIECFDRQLQDMALNSVNKTHPAKLKELTVQWTRAVRAHSAHMDIETHNDLAEFEEKFRQLSQSLKRNQHFILISNDYTPEGSCK